MRAQDHPQFNQERERLALTLDHIHRWLGRGFRPAGGDDWANQRLAFKDSEYRRRLQEAEQRAYVGRVDVLAEDTPEVFYVGRHFLDFPDEARVYSWADTQVGRWFYNYGDYPSLLLRRTFEIRQSDLLSIDDDYVHPSLSHELIEDRFTDSLLFRLLSENRTGQLHDIIATIQAQQYHIIQLPVNQLLVIQGAAASGKSSIALHRVAYLLFHHRKRLERIVVLGPNRLFMEYTASILPALGERHIPQMPVDELLLTVLGARVECLSIDTFIETLMSDRVSATEKRTQYRNAQLKGSLKMAALLESYTRLRASPPNTGGQPLVCRVTVASARTKRDYAFEARRTDADIRALLEKYKSLPLHKMRDEVEKELVSSLSRELSTKLYDALGTANGWLNDDERRDERLKAEREVKQTVRRYLREWRKLSAPDAYRRLLGSPELLARAGKGIFSSSELERLAYKAPSARIPFQFCDLPALAYLKILLDGADGPNGRIMFDHIVVDEAQDLSPMHFRVLSRLMSRVSMTVLGDLTQDIYTHSGIHAWEDIEQATGQKVHQEAIRQSYRSTQQITELANDMLTRAGADQARLAEPIARTGHAPTFRGHGSPHDLADTVLQLARQESRDGRSSIAVICKTAAGCASLAQRLTSSGFSGYHLITDRNASLATGVVIMPSYLTKGLEFDAVIIADADKHTYPPDKLGSGRLLYVAMTRATHALHICWVGTLTPLLSAPNAAVTLEPSSKPEMDGDMRSSRHKSDGQSVPHSSVETIIARENAEKYVSKSDSRANSENRGHYGLHVLGRQKDGRFLSDIVADDYREDSHA